jgi:hypothetical protein
MVVQLGLPTALVVWFVYWSQKREKELAVRIAELEREYRVILIDLVRKTDVNLERQSEVMMELAEAVKQSNQQVTILLTRMAERPCLVNSH